MVSGIWVEAEYTKTMPRVRSAERPVELVLGHGKRVFVTNEEFDRYQRFDGWTEFGGLCAVLGAFGYAWVRRHEAQKHAQNR